MTDPMTPERLAEIEQRFASGRVVNVVTQRALGQRVWESAA